MANMERRSRVFWEKTIRAFEASAETHASFAHSYGVTVGALRHWLYKP